MRRVAIHPRSLAVLALVIVGAGLWAQASAQPTSNSAPTPRTGGGDDNTGRRWLAGDHHVHSHYSVGWDDHDHNPATAPNPILGGDGIYPITKNAQMARRYGLSWMVSTDHGGPGHSKINRDIAYPELLRSRAEVPEVLQFYGMEFDTPGADHSSLIVPHTSGEREALFDIESAFAKHEPWPEEPSRDEPSVMIDALKFADAMAVRPVIIANHPSRSAGPLSAYGLDRPEELRDWNDTAPQVAIGMEGAPGHQAATLNRDGRPKVLARRGGYSQTLTLGGFDPMTAKLGGFWDSMLGEGRPWRVTSTSDSHVHYTEGGNDFWPGEFSKTYVYARFDQDDILDGLRQGRVFVTTGDLVSALDVRVTGGGSTVGMGGRLHLAAGRPVTIEIRVQDPKGANAAGQMPDVARVDLIAGDVTGANPVRSADANPSTRVIKRFTAADWTRDGEVLTMTYVLNDLHQSAYIRVRGTNTDQLEPKADAPGENPWSDLWFYSNAIFIRVGE
jgi:hypothetical protein